MPGFGKLNLAEKDKAVKRVKKKVLNWLRDKRGNEIVREMIFGQPPTLDHVLEALREIELRVNASCTFE